MKKFFRYLSPVTILFRWRIVNFLRVVLFTPVDALAFLAPTRSQKHGVLVVRLDAIGDFIMWLRAAAYLRDAFPGRLITLVGNKDWLPLANNLSFWDSTIAVDVSKFQTNLKYRIKTLRSVRELGFEIAFNPVYSRKFFSGDSIMRVSGSKKTIGVSCDLANMTRIQKWISDRWYSNLVYIPAGLKEVESNMIIMRELGCNIGEKYKKIDFNSHAVSSSLVLPRDFVIIFPGASTASKQWPEKKFSEIINIIASRYPSISLVLCGSAKEYGLCERIASASDCEVTNLAGYTSLPDFLEVVRSSKLLIGNDTSAVHIASAVDVPSICILGGGHFGRFLPYPKSFAKFNPEVVFKSMPCFNCGWRCSIPHAIGSAFPCVSDVEVEDVAARLSFYLGRPQV